jgi:hypothetical protein
MADSTEIWQTLTATALVGTSRQQLHLPPPGDPLGNLLAELDPAGEPERALLSGAAAVALYRQAGKTSPTLPTSPPDPCPLDDSPVVSPRAAQHLSWMLNKSYQDVLPEWLAAATAAGQRLPDEYLVALLEYGKKKPLALREAIAALPGKRMRWLAAQNPAWSYAAGDIIYQQDTGEDTITATWETGSTADRRALVQHLRRADPARGREMLEATWQSEKLDDRKTFIELCAEGLSMDDEPFLERVLDDRSMDVRSLAAAHLARLPESRLYQRMQERSANLLIYHPGTGKKKAKATIDIALPDECDAAMQRDGIKSEPPSHFKAGPRAWWARQMLSFVPPAHWYQQWNITPQELLHAAARSDWEELLLYAWARSASYARDILFLELLLPKMIKQQHTTELEWLTSNLPVERLDDIIIQMIQEQPQPLLGKQPAMILLQAHPSMWGEKLARTVLTSLRQRCGSHENPLKTNRPSHIVLRNALDQFALRIPPPLAPEVATGWPTTAPHWNYWEEVIHQVIDIVNFRFEMMKEFVV